MSAISQLSNHYVSNESQDCESVEPRAHVIRQYPKPAFEAFEMSNWKWFPNIEQPKEPKSQKNVECRKPVSTRSVPERDHLSYDFVNYNPLSIMTPQMLNA
jgi:hypothetical protein